MTKTNTAETTAIRIHGPHHAALRRRSVNVFDGAMNVLIIRAPSDIGGTAGGGVEIPVGVGETGAAAMKASLKVRPNSSLRRTLRQARSRAAKAGNRRAVLRWCPCSIPRRLRLRFSSLN